jgi:squalene/oxidosqualene cyclase-like protein
VPHAPASVALRSFAADGTLRAEARAAVLRALDNLARRQVADGAWEGDYGGPTFLLPMFLALCQATGRLPGAGRDRMVAHLRRAQAGRDFVGLHLEDPRGSMFATVLVYVARRILGGGPDEPEIAAMRRWIAAGGSPLGAASWGKFVLCLLGLYDWRGVHPILPELWLLPPQAPFHPGRLWCHCRQVYLPMAWLYGRRAVAPEDALVRALRDELYGGRFHEVDWAAHRDSLAAADAYRPSSRVLRAANRAQAAFERACPGALRRRAMDRVLEHIRYEDRVTQGIDIGPVNRILNAFVQYFDDPDGAPFHRAFAACERYLRDDDDGSTGMQGYESSKLWDTAFAVQAALAARALDTHRPMIDRAYGYLRDNQILDDVPDAERYWRHRSRGGWPFSSRAHGWPITDCTSEALKCALDLAGQFRPTTPERLLDDAVALILSWQNDDGGWATYERQRAGAWLERFNPSQVFGEIMVDRSYVECTSACVQALVRARPRLNGAAAGEAERAIERGVRFLRTQQRPDGSFEGSWGVCFTYGTWFGVSGLVAAGARPDDPALARACAFLLRAQRVDGGWGEDGASCRERRYIPARDAGMAQSAWALSTLVRAGHPSRGAQESAVRLLLAGQAADGGWPREAMVGVFNKTCLIHYDNYRHYFPLWALAEWESARLRAAS